MNYPCYSKEGLEYLIKSCEETLAGFEKEKSNLGKLWTQSHIDGYTILINNLIKDETIQMEKYKEELKRREKDEK